METVSVEKYEQTSNEIGQAKTKIFDAFAALHDDLCHLAELERGLESERVSGVQNTQGLARNAPELVESITAHNKQLGLPTSAVFSLVDNVIALIDQHNRSLMNGAIEKLPAIFSASNRLQEFTTGKG